MAETGSLDAALNLQAARNERIVSIGAVAALLVGAVLVGGLMILGSPGSTFRTSTGPSLIGLSLAVALWHAGAAALLVRGRGSKVFPWVNSAVDASLPALVMLVEAQHETPEYVAYASLGPLIFSVVFVVASLRLRWQIPLMVGLLGAELPAHPRQHRAGARLRTTGGQLLPRNGVRGGDHAPRAARGQQDPQ